MVLRNSVISVRMFFLLRCFYFVLQVREHGTGGGGEGGRGAGDMSSCGVVPQRPLERLTNGRRGGGGGGRRRFCVMPSYRPFCREYISCRNGRASDVWSVFIQIRRSCWRSVGSWRPHRAPRCPHRAGLALASLCRHKERRGIGTLCLLVALAMFR